MIKILPHILHEVSMWPMPKRICCLLVLNQLMKWLFSDSVPVWINN